MEETRVCKLTAHVDLLQYPAIHHKEIYERAKKDLFLSLYEQCPSNFYKNIRIMEGPPDEEQVYITSLRYQRADGQYVMNGIFTAPEIIRERVRTNNKVIMLIAEI